MGNRRRDLELLAAVATLAFLAMMFALSQAAPCLCEMRPVYAVITARGMLQPHQTDNHWNWSLANDDQLAKPLLSYLDQQKTEQWVLSWLDETANAS